MRAIEYEKKLTELLAAGTAPVKALQAILEDFLREAEELRQTRRATTDSAHAAILREQSAKWRALSRMHDLVPPDGFYQAIQYAMTTHGKQRTWEAVVKAGFDR